MKKKYKHSLRYRIWNQNRLAVHISSMYQIFDILTQSYEGKGWPGITMGPISSIRIALYQSMIIHFDMIKSNQGVSLYNLISEAEEASKIDNATANDLKNKIDSKSVILRNIGRQRNNIVAHRSSSQTFREVREAYPITNDDLRDLVKIYYDVTVCLWKSDPFQNIWKLKEERLGMEQIMECVFKYVPEQP